MQKKCNGNENTRKKVRKMLLEKKTLEKVIYFFLTRSLINFVLDGVKKLGFFVGS